jgi:hypothetical protein
VSGHIFWPCLKCILNFFSLKHAYLISCVFSYLFCVEIYLTWKFICSEFDLSSLMIPCLVVLSLNPFTSLPKSVNKKYVSLQPVSPNLKPIPCQQETIQPKPVSVRQVSHVCLRIVSLKSLIFWNKSEPENLKEITLPYKTGTSEQEKPVNLEQVSFKPVRNQLSWNLST